MKNFLLFTLVSIATSTFAQPTESKIDRKDLKRFITILSSDSLNGRETGSAGERKAARLISDQFKKLGLKPQDSTSYLEKFKLRQLYWNDVYLKVQGNTLENFTNMVFQGNQSENTEVEKEVVFGGTGSDQELNQIEAEDRFVLVFVNNLRSYYELNKKLGKKKAYGLILANPRNNNQFESIKRTFRDYTLQKRFFLQPDTLKGIKNKFLDTLRIINTILIPNNQIKNILGISQKDLEKLIKENRVHEAPIKQVYGKFEKIENEVETTNVVGRIQGKTNKTIVISAHYDHLGKMKKDQFPGADDNASGVAALLELAEQFSPSLDLPYSIVFVATSGEEAGLLGSQYHVNNPRFDPKNILCNLNMDMISRVDENHTTANYLYCIGTDQSVELDNLVRKADKLYKGCTVDFSLNDSKSSLFSRSDNYNFYKKGIISLHFFSGLHADYHKPTDTFEKIDYQNLEHRVQLISTVISLIQKDGLE